MRISRRGFIWSTIGGLGIAAYARRGAAALRFGIVGWGARGSRYLEAVQASHIGVEALCDIDADQLERGTDALGRAQRAEVAAASDYRRLLDSLKAPHVIVSAPFPQAAAIARAAVRRGKTVLLDSSTLFENEAAEQVAEAVRTGAIYAVGLDPRWPALTTRNLLSHARSRGADRVQTHFWHASWNTSQLRAASFEILDALSHGGSRGHARTEFFELRGDASGISRRRSRPLGSGSMISPLSLNSVWWKRHGDGRNN
jgi:hypothetical protein